MGYVIEAFEGASATGFVHASYRLNHHDLMVLRSDAYEIDDGGQLHATVIRFVWPS